MVEFSLFDKIIGVYNLIASSPLFLILLLGIMIMLIDALYISKNSTKTKQTYAIISLLVVVLLIYSYLDSVLKIFDGVAKGAVAIVYFPSVLEYILTIIISLIILIYSFVSSKISVKIRRINFIVFILNAFLFFLLVDQIANNDVDLTNKVSIYTNSNMMILLELSIFIFVAWLIGLTLYKIIKNLTPSEEKDEEVNLITETNFYNAPSVPNDLNKLRNEALMAEPKIIYVEKERVDDLFTLEEYREMKEILDERKKQKALESTSEETIKNPSYNDDIYNLNILNNSVEK